MKFAVASAAPICLWKCILPQSEPSSDVDFYYQWNPASKRAEKGLGQEKYVFPAQIFQVLRRLREGKEIKRHPLVPLRKKRAAGECSESGAHGQAL